MSAATRPVLDFDVGEFNDGLNVTVRRGYKWRGNVLSADKAPWFPITVKGEPTDKIAIVLEAPHKPFIHVADDELALEHDPKCRDWFELLEVMKETYDGFEPTDSVTVVKFKVATRREIAEWFTERSGLFMEYP